MSVLAFSTPALCGCDAEAINGTLVCLDEALDFGRDLVLPVMETETVPLHQAHGRILAEPLIATTPSPAFDNAAMDGYALRLADFTGEGPWTLPVVGRIPAGQAPPENWPHGTVLRIFTGAPIPQDADCVVMQEAVDHSEDVITLGCPPPNGAHIRFCGEDIATGDILLPAGTSLGPRQIALAAGTGAGTLRVKRRPRAALLTTGDEVIAAGGSLAPGQIWDVNTPMITALLEDAGIEITQIWAMPDNHNTLRDQLIKTAKEVDLIMTSGGVSVGEEDHVHTALRAAGGHIAVAGVAVKPGKPVTLARIGGTLVIGLPGNPVSAYTTLYVLGLPLLDQMSGATSSSRRRNVTIEAPISHKPGRCELRPAQIVGQCGSGLDVVETGGTVKSASLLPLERADGLILIPADVEELPAGSLIDFIPFA